jgi:hypothetical protein
MGSYEYVRNGTTLNNGYRINPAVNPEKLLMVISNCLRNFIVGSNTRGSDLWKIISSADELFQITYHHRPGCGTDNTNGIKFD